MDCGLRPNWFWGGVPSCRPARNGQEPEWMEARGTFSTTITLRVSRAVHSPAAGGAPEWPRWCFSFLNDPAIPAGACMPPQKRQAERAFGFPVVEFTRGGRDRDCRAAVVWSIRCSSRRWTARPPPSSPSTSRPPAVVSGFQGVLQWPVAAVHRRQFESAPIGFAENRPVAIYCRVVGPMVTLRRPSLSWHAPTNDGILLASDLA
jgi:hypothetical protein